MQIKGDKTDSYLAGKNSSGTVIGSRRRGEKSGLGREEMRLELQYPEVWKSQEGSGIL